jgi:hypothetical protein
MKSITTLKSFDDLKIDLTELAANQFADQVELALVTSVVHAHPDRTINAVKALRIPFYVAKAPAHLRNKILENRKMKGILALVNL